MTETHRNNFLFSDHHLTHQLPALPDWQAIDVEVSLQTLTAIWERFTPRPGDAAHTESEWVRPVLQALGHHVPSMRLRLLGTHPSIRFAPAANGARAPAFIIHAGDPKSSVVVVHSRAWDSPLDQPAPVEQDTSYIPGNINPAGQLRTHMRRAGLRWGILTNGRCWRLYHRETAGETDACYEIDLPALIEQTISGETAKWNGIGPVDAFKYFYLFFRREAFTDNPCWQNNMLTAAHGHKHIMSQRLKQQAAEALQLLAQGFLSFPANALKPTPDTLKAVYDNSLIVLYWLLFILYAESRRQLPVNQNRAYTESYSLHALTRRVGDDLRQKKPAVSSMDEIWSYLRRLWRVLHAGNADLNVPAHYGGLFDLGRYPFLKHNRVGDTHLRQAIDLLARTEDPVTRQITFVDYRDLEIRHLGSIYEHLLEHHLPGERKSTGSYYTPDHIVQWLVEQTVGPTLDNVRQRHTIRQPDGSYRITTSRQALIDDILAIKILDPAMGSGHFLVEATDFMARYIVSLGLGPMADLGDESELTYWRRRVVQSCIFGVDVDPLAVELSKLSLWSLTAGHGKPLSFLDHHLRCGDSLLGVRMADLHLGDGRRASSPSREQHEFGQLSMLDDEAFVRSMRTATGFMEQIQALGSETADDVRQADRLYHDKLRAVTRRYRLLADIWTARHFGLHIGSALWSQLVRHALQDDLDAPPYADVVQHARTIAQRRRFFHWELEFPEVFFDPAPQSNSAGFDVIIGNPPYLFGEHIPAEVKPFLRRHYKLATGQYDLYWLFYERSFWLLKQHGRHGFIVPDAMLARDEGEALRTRLVAEYRIHAIAPLGHTFHNQGVSTALIVWEKSRPHDHTLDVWQYRDDSWHRVRSVPLAALANVPKRRLWVELNSKTRAVVRHIAAQAVPLRDFAAVSRGEEAGRRQLRPIAAQGAGDIPIVVGSDISPLAPPAPSHCIAEHKVTKADSIYQPGKIVMVKTGRNIVCTIDQTGYVTLQSVYNLNLHSGCQVHAGYLAAVLSSSLLSWYLRATVTGYKQVFPQTNQSNVEELPIRPIDFTTPADTRAGLLEKGKRLYNLCTSQDNLAGIIGFVQHQLDREPERADIVHDLLAWLAEQTLELNMRRQDLQARLDPFEHLDRDVPFVVFGDTFAQTSEVSETSEVYAMQSVRHDIDRLRLAEAGGGWELQVLLKKRNPQADWRLWQKEAGRNRIAREWVTARRLSLPNDQARYYELAFEVIDEFSGARSFPSGHTRTTRQKLQAARVPAFDPRVDLQLMIAHRNELARVEGRIARTREIIDQIVYRLYGLTDADIAEIR
ncbi:MAG: Eco57I restriction-modification methylase domain-containing protein [Anaerolineae bacterium]